MRGKLHKLAMILNATIKCKHEAEVSSGKFVAGLVPGASNTGYQLTFPLNMTRHWKEVTCNRMNSEDLILLVQCEITFVDHSF